MPPPTCSGTTKLHNYGLEKIHKHRFMQLLIMLYTSVLEVNREGEGVLDQMVVMTQIIQV